MFNFRVGLIFNSRGLISIRVELILNGYNMSYPSCKKNVISIKNWQHLQPVSHIYTKLTKTNGMTNGAQFETVWTISTRFKC
jgi:hypothetical protein